LAHGKGVREDTQLLAQAWRVIATLFSVAGDHLRAHHEYCLVQLLRRLSDDGRTVPEQREGLLQALAHLASPPYYLVDLYVNYDCELHGTNLCDDLVRYLATTAAGCSADALLALSAAGLITSDPAGAVAAVETLTSSSTVAAAPNAPTPLQLLCLEPLLLAFQHMVDRCEQTVRVPFSLASPRPPGLQGPACVVRSSLALSVSVCVLWGTWVHVGTVRDAGGQRPVPC
jgi:hypothetical protein